NAGDHRTRGDRVDASASHALRGRDGSIASRLRPGDQQLISPTSRPEGGHLYAVAPRLQDATPPMDAGLVLSSRKATPLLVTLALRIRKRSAIGTAPGASP